MKRVLLTLVLLFSASSVALASDLDDGLAAYESQDYATALEKFRKAATQAVPSLDEFLVAQRQANPGVSDTVHRQVWEGTYALTYKASVFAQFLLGLMYSQGHGVPQDDQQAMSWHRKAAEAGYGRAQVMLGTMYHDGRGVPQDYQQAVRWFTKAAEKGNKGAQYYLGLMYDFGKGVPQDHAQAASWYRKAAEQGSTKAQGRLGTMYEMGKGVPLDYKQAVYWYTKAAEAGDTVAQTLLGNKYGAGMGVPQDYVRAHLWYNLAAANGDENAVKLQDLLAEQMTPHQLAEAQRLAREWKPTTGTVPDRQQESDGRELAASGTGFVVSRQGHVLTNHHVIDGCTALRGAIEGRKQQLTVIGTDAKNDLAILKLPDSFPSAAHFREGRAIRAGDSVVVVGFPLRGVLASEANVTTGTVSALAGLGSDTRFLQITAPVQPGNSGGPLLDQSGQIVGVVVSKLNALTIARATGDIPQNINFAINGAVVKAFLDSQSVEYETSASSKRMEPAEIGAAAKKFTLLLECYR